MQFGIDNQPNWVFTNNTLEKRALCFGSSSQDLGFSNHQFARDSSSSAKSASSSSLLLIVSSHTGHFHATLGVVHDWLSTVNRRWKQDRTAVDPPLLRTSSHRQQPEDAVETLSRQVLRYRLLRSHCWRPGRGEVRRLLPASAL